MLGARMRAAGDVNVDRLIEFQLFLQPLAQFERVAFGVGLRVFAVTIPGAGDNPAGGMRLFGAESDFFQRALERQYEGIWDVGNDEILPDGESDFATGIIVGEVRHAE